MATIDRRCPFCRGRLTFGAAINSKGSSRAWYSCDVDGWIIREWSRGSGVNWLKESEIPSYNDNSPERRQACDALGAGYIQGLPADADANAERIDSALSVGVQVLMDPSNE